MIARATVHRRNRRNLQKNPGLLALTIGPITGAAVATDSVTIAAPSGTLGVYVRSTRIEDYTGWTNTPAATMIPEEPIAVSLAGFNQVKLQYPTTPAAADVFHIPAGETAFRTRLGGQIPAQSIVIA